MEKAAAFFFFFFLNWDCWEQIGYVRGVSAKCFQVKYTIRWQLQLTVIMETKWAMPDALFYQRRMWSRRGRMWQRAGTAACWDGTRAMLPSNLWVGQRVGENLLVLFSLEAMQLHDTKPYAAQRTLGNVSAFELGHQHFLIVWCEKKRWSSEASVPAGCLLFLFS